MKIQKLPPEARTKFESGVIITDTVQCVLELVRNCLDADASGIVVRVDLKNFRINVIDNGKGIGRDDLELVGEKYMTSKYHSFSGSNSSCSTYGYKGQALSSMLDFCRSLTIKTKSDRDGPTLVKVFVKSKAGKITELDNKNCGTGTTIIIEDFMYAMPVRRKRIKEVFEMEEIKTQLQYLALIHYNVCFTLRNENKGLLLLQTPKASNMLEMISNLYGKTIAKNLKPVKYEENNYKVTGYANTKLSKQNNIQIVYLNRQIIAKGMIHKFINNVMKEYNGSNTMLTESPAEQVLKKLKNSHYAFIIEIKCSQECYEVFTNLRKTTVEFKNWKDVLKCIHKGLKKTYKVDCNGSDDSVKNTEDDGKFGTSVLVNAVKGVPATRGFKRKRNTKKPNREVNKKASFNESNENSKLSVTDSKVERDDECTIDTLETPIPKNRKTITRKINCAKFNPDMSYIEFYKWLKASFKTDANAFNLYSEFLQHKNEKTNTVNSESFKSPVLGVKLKEKPISLMKSKIPEKKQKNQRGSGILSKEIALMTKDSLKMLPNVDLRMKKAVQFNTETHYNVSKISNFGYTDWKKREDEIFLKPDVLTRTKGQKRLEVIQTVSSPASSEIHFTNIIKFRNLPEAFHPENLPVEEELCTNTWMSHYQNNENDNFVPLSNISRNTEFLERRHKKKIEFRDEIIQTSYPEVPQKVNVMVQTLQTIPESSCNSEQINEIPIPDFWNISTPENHPDALGDLNKIISLKIREQKQSDSSEFVCAQRPKSHSNPKSNTETETLPHLWTDSLSEFGNAGQNQDSDAKPDSIPKTIPLESSPQFCLTERHDFVPKGLSPRFFNSQAVEIPNLDPRERNRIQLTIDDVTNELLTVKWQDESTGQCAKPEISDAVFGEMNMNAEKKSINFESQILSASLSYCAIKVHNLLHSFTFTKDLLSSVEVLGQLDEKFIVTKMKVSSPKYMELISLLDQHAVDERIKLEEIINEYTKSEKFVSISLRPSMELTFNESEVRLIIDLREKMLNFGFDIKPKNQDTVTVESIPTFLSDKYNKENKKDSSLQDILQTVIIDIVSEVTETRGAGSKIPKIIHDRFCSEACHSAIKFNKALTKEAMIKMISSLKNCKLPFQCAHGRPSVIPIIDLEDFKSTEEEDDYNIDLEKIRKFCSERNKDVVESPGGVKF